MDSWKVCLIRREESPEPRWVSQCGIYWLLMLRLLCRMIDTSDHRLEWAKYCVPKHASAQLILDDVALLYLESHSSITITMRLPPLPPQLRPIHQILVSALE